MPNKKNTNSFFVKHRKIGIILFFGFIVRLISINQSLWLDEAINVTAARDKNLIDLLFNYSIGDFHPPLFHLVLWIWFKFFPANEIFSRLPSVIFGFGTILLTYKIAKKIFKKNKTALLASALLASSGLHIYYSQEARMYSIAAFFVSLTFFSLLNLKNNSNINNKMFFIFSLSLMLMTDYQPWLLLPLFIFFTPLLSLVALGSTVWWWPTLIKQIKVGLTTAYTFPIWKAVVGKLTLKSFLLVPVKFLVGRISIDNNLIFSIVLLIPMIIVLSCIYIVFKNKKSRLFNLWLFLPIIFGVLISLWIPIFSYFRFLFLLPAFYLLISNGALKFSKNYKTLVISILLFTNIVSSAVYLFNPVFHRENWKALSTYVNSFKIDSTTAIIPNLAQLAAFNYYDKSNTIIYDINSIEMINNPATIIFIDYVSDIFDPQKVIEKAISDKNYQIEEEIIFNGVFVKRYIKPNENIN